MKKAILFLIVIAVAGCDQLERFHDSEIAIEIEYVSVLLDDFHEGNMNEDIREVGRYFVNDSTLIWMAGAEGKIGKGWTGLKEVKELDWALKDSLRIRTNDRIINMDDRGTLAWFSESVDLQYKIGDSSFVRKDVLISGVLQKLGQRWKIVQYHTVYPCL